MGEVKDLTPKLVDKWAKKYIDVYSKEGYEEAKKWALRFLKGPDLVAMGKRVNEMLHKGDGKRE